MKKKMDFTSLSLGLIVGVLVSLIGYAGFLRKSSSALENEPVPTAITEPGYVPNPTEPTSSSSRKKVENSDRYKVMDITKWKRYSYKELGISFLAPPDAEVTDTLAQQRAIHVIFREFDDVFYTPVTITVRPNASRLKLKEWYLQSSASSHASWPLVEQFTVQGREALSFHPFSKSPALYYIVDGDRVFSISIKDTSEYPLIQEDVMDRIVHSFTF